MVTNSWHLTEFYSQRIDPSLTDLKAGVLLTSHAFGIGMPSIGAQVVTIAVVYYLLYLLLLVGLFMEKELQNIYLELAQFLFTDTVMYLWFL